MLRVKLEDHLRFWLFFFTLCVFSLQNSSCKTHEELLPKMPDWTVKSYRLINRPGTGWKYKKVPNGSSMEHSVIKGTFICNRLCTEENHMSLLVGVAVNLHSNTEFRGCTCVSAQDQTSLLNVLTFSAKLQPTQWVNTLPSKACLSSQLVLLGVNKKASVPLQLREPPYVPLPFTTGVAWEWELQSSPLQSCQSEIKELCPGVPPQIHLKPALEQR